MTQKPVQKPAQNDAQEASPSQSLFQKLEKLEQETSGSAHTGHNRWMVPYADLLTLLLGLFLVLMTATQAETAAQTKAQAPAQSQLEADAEQLANPMSPTETALADKLQTQLKDELNLKGVEIHQQERGVVISLKDSILFAPGKAELSPQALQTLDRLTDELRVALGPEARPVRVEGHTDNTPIQTSQFPSNWELSTARATNIVRYLVAERQFSPEMLSAAGYGEFKPVSDNSTIEGKQKNRRVDIVILNSNTAKQEPPTLPAPTR